MDYELVIDLTDAGKQAYMSNIQTLFASIIPQFNVHDRNKYFSSIQLKCNLNTLSLPDAKLLPTLQDLNDTKPEALNGSLLKFNTIQRPSLNQFMQKQKQKNILHKKRMNKSPNSSPSYSPSNSSSNSLPNQILNNTKVKNRTFIQNNKIIKTNTNNNGNTNSNDIEIKQALQSSLPSPRNPNNNNNNYNINNNNSPPPPSYKDVVTAEQKQREIDNTDMKLQEEKDAKVAEELQQKLFTPKSNGNDNVNQFGLSDSEWKLQHELLSKNDSNIHAPHNELDDYTFALKLQQAQANEDEDMKIAMQLQKEENLKIEVERRRNRYRNPNFSDWGSQPSDYISNDSYSMARRQMRHNEGDNINRNNRWNPSIDDIISNNGGIPPVFRRILDDDNDDNTGDDLDEILAVANNMYGNRYLHGIGMRGMHGHGRRGRIDDSWQRLPIRTLNVNDIEILSKSEEKKSCPICMADFKINDVTRQLPCFHEFHKDCVDKWFHQQNDKGKEASCPLDRKKIKDTANQQV